MGWCSLDPKRCPLTGRELRGCWQARRTHAEALDEDGSRRLRQQAGITQATPLKGDAEEAGTPPARDFVPVELLRPIVAVARPEPAAGAPPHPPPLPAIADVDDVWVDRTSLFGDLDP
jgi:hypothetical protein